MLIPLQIPPGIHRNGTDLQSAGRWRDANLVRWRENAMLPVGGWRSFGDTTLNAAPRGAHSWVSSTGARWLAFGTYSKLYVVSGDGTTTDVTPAGFTSGREDAAANTGYGGGFYNQGTYGTARPETGTFSEATQWTMDNWGEYLVACSPDDGKLYEWQLNTGSAAAAITNAPTSCSAVVVTEERFVMALGAGNDDRKVQWCDKEANTTWTPSATNEAGSQVLQTAGAIQCGVKVRGQTLILTNTDAWAATYIGYPLVYGFSQVGDGCGAVSRQGVATLDGVAYWLGKEAFYRYEGGVVQEIPCEASDFIFGDINRDQVTKAWAVANGRYGEIWWFFPSASSIECDKYICFDPQQGIWSVGMLDRTAGVDSGAARYPVWFDSGGDGYQHETDSFSWGSSSIYAETGPVSVGQGETSYSVTELLPDEKTQGDVTATFKTRFYPNDTEREYGPYTLSAPTSVRFTGRQVRMRVTGSNDVSWRVGTMRLRGEMRGKR